MDKEIIELLESLKSIIKNNQPRIDELKAKIMFVKFDYYHSLTIEELSEKFENMSLEGLEYITNYAKEINDLSVYEIAYPVLEKKKEFEEALPRTLDEKVEGKLKNLQDGITTLREVLADDMFIKLKYGHAIQFDPFKLNADALSANCQQMDIKMLQFYLDMALHFEDFEICNIISPILNKKKALL